MSRVISFFKNMWDKKKRFFYIPLALGGRPSLATPMFQIFIFKSDGKVGQSPIQCGLWKNDRAGDFSNNDQNVRIWVTATQAATASDIYDRIEKTLTHELAHKFQYLYNPDQFSDYIDPDENFGGYIRHPTEVEAEYYAVLHKAQKKRTPFYDQLPPIRRDACVEFATMMAERHPNFPFIDDLTAKQYLDELG